MIVAFGNLVDELERLVDEGTIPNNFHTTLALISLNKAILYIASGINYEKKNKALWINI